VVKTDAATRRDADKPRNLAKSHRRVTH
jgi:hypothetical protein